MLSEESREVNNRRFAIQYEILSTPITNRHQGEKMNVYELNHGKIAYLWTVIEYIGNNQFIDLITEEVYVSQLFEENILDTVTKEYEKEALEIKERLLENPLAIGSFRSRFGIGRLLIKPLDIRLKARILCDMQKIDEIKNQVELLKREARERINQFYEEKNTRKMIELQEQAEKENKEFDTKRASANSIINKRFNSLFPADTATKILAKRRNIKSMDK